MCNQNKTPWWRRLIGLTVVCMVYSLTVAPSHASMCLLDDEDCADVQIGYAPLPASTDAASCEEMLYTIRGTDDQTKRPQKYADTSKYDCEICTPEKPRKQYGVYMWKCTVKPDKVCPDSKDTSRFVGTTESRQAVLKALDDECKAKSGYQVFKTGKSLDSQYICGHCEKETSVCSSGVPEDSIPDGCYEPCVYTGESFTRKGKTIRCCTKIDPMDGWTETGEKAPQDTSGYHHPKWDGCHDLLDTKKTQHGYECYKEDPADIVCNEPCEISNGRDNLIDPSKEACSCVKRPCEEFKTSGKVNDSTGHLTIVRDNIKAESYAAKTTGKVNGHCYRNELANKGCNHGYSCYYHFELDDVCPDGRSRSSDCSCPAGCPAGTLPEGSSELKRMVNISLFNGGQKYYQGGNPDNDNSYKKCYEYTDCSSIDSMLVGTSSGDCACNGSNWHSSAPSCSITSTDTRTSSSFTNQSGTTHTITCSQYETVSCPSIGYRNGSCTCSCSGSWYSSAPSGCYTEGETKTQTYTKTDGSTGSLTCKKYNEIRCYGYEKRQSDCSCKFECPSGSESQGAPSSMTCPVESSNSYNDQSGNSHTCYSYSKKSCSGSYQKLNTSSCECETMSCSESNSSWFETMPDTCWTQKATSRSGCYTCKCQKSSDTCTGNVGSYKTADDCMANGMEPGGTSCSYQCETLYSKCETAAVCSDSVKQSSCNGSFSLGSEKACEYEQDGVTKRSDPIGSCDGYSSYSQCKKAGKCS